MSEEDKRPPNKNRPDSGCGFAVFASDSLLALAFLRHVHDFVPLPSCSYLTHVTVTCDTASSSAAALREVRVGSLLTRLGPVCRRFTFIADSYRSKDRSEFCVNVCETTLQKHRYRRPEELY